MGELAIGVAVGVGLGDLIVHFIGSGWWQVTVVLATSALVARFIDRGALLATQAGVQAIVIVGLPATQTGGPGGRLVDALVGARSPCSPRRSRRATRAVGPGSSGSRRPRSWPRRSSCSPAGSARGRR
ncbi:FUSC family protein [Oerskovia sp. M15]